MRTDGPLSRLGRLLFNLPQDSLEEESTRKTVMLYMIVLLGIFFLVLLGSIAARTGNVLLAALDYSVAGFMIGLYLYVRISGRVRAGALVGSGVILVFFLTLFVTGAADGQAFLWYYTYPLVSLFLLGAGAGSLLSVLLIAVTMLLLLFGDPLSFYPSFSPGLLIRFFFSYITVLLFTLIFENTRLTTRRKLERTMSELNELVIRDGLTGLYNRRYFDEVVSRIVRQFRRTGTTAAFLMADLDFFKNYNDAYGHRAGDAVLNTFASVLASCVRRSTDHAFRNGGEEFAVLLLPTNRETAENFAETVLRETRALQIPHAGSPLGILTVSIGIALMEINGELGFQEMIDTADAAMYRAKAAGRDNYVILEQD